MRPASVGPFLSGRRSRWYVHKTAKQGCWSILGAHLLQLGEQIHSPQRLRHGAGYTLAHEGEDIPLRGHVEHDRTSSADESALENGSLSARTSRTNLTDENEPTAANYHFDATSEDEVGLIGNEQLGLSSVSDKAGIILVRIPYFCSTMMPDLLAGYS